MGSLADAHVHLFERGFTDRHIDPGTELSAYELLRREFGVVASLVVGYEGAPRYADNNAYLSGLVRTKPWLFPLAHLRTDDPPSREHVVGLGARLFVGVSIYVLGERALREFTTWPAAAWAALNDAGCIISINASMHHLEALRPALEQLRDASVLISHLGLPGRVESALSAEELRSIYHPLTSLAPLPHVGVKASGLYALGPEPDTSEGDLWAHLEVVLSAFGHERLYWGSDFSPCLDHGTFEHALGAGVYDRLSPTEAADIRGGNLLRLVSARSRTES